jgi:hypothetical protein
MGCGSSISAKSINLNPDEKKRIYNKNKENFENIQKRFKEEVMNKTFVDDLDNLEKNKVQNLKSEMKILWSKYKNLFEKASIKKKSFNDLILNLIGENILKSKFIYEEHDVTKFLQKLIDDKFTNLGSNDKANLSNLILGSNLVIPKVVKSFRYYIDVIPNEIAIFWKAVNDNLKYNYDFDMNCFTIIFTPILINHEELVNDLCSYLEYNENLFCVNLIISPQNLETKNKDLYNLNAKSYSSLYKIFLSIRKNKNIKVLLFHCSKFYKIVIPPEIYLLILEKVKEDNMIGFHLGKFSVSEEFFEILFDSIKPLKNLFFLGLDTKMINKYLIEKLKTNLEKNNSISIFILAGLNDSKETEVVNDIKSKIKNVKLFHYEKNFNLV